MPGGRRIRIGVMLLALVNMLPAVEADKSWGLPVLALLAMLLSWALGIAGGGRRTPRPVLYTAVFASVSYLIFEMFLEGPSVYILDLAHFIILLACCKFFDLRTNRDIGLMAVIAFLLLVIGGLVSGNLLFAAAVIVDTTFGVWWLIAFHVKCQTEAIVDRRRKAFPRQLADTAFVDRVDCGVRPSRHLGVVLTCAAGMVSVSTVLFVAVPRGWGRSLFGGFQRVVAAPVTGFTDQVVLGDSGVLESNAPVMRVRFTRGGRLLDGTFSPYLRGVTRDIYHSGDWQRMPTGSSATRYRLEGGSTVPLTTAIGSLNAESFVKQEVWLDEKAHYLFAMYPPIAVSSDDISFVARDDENWSLRLPVATERSGHYIVYSSGEVEADGAAAIAGDTIPRPRLKGFRSNISPELLRFAVDLAKRFGDPANPDHHEAIARGIESFLRSEPFEYALDGGGDRPSDRDPVEHFLMHGHRGHCEYFASAMTLICQANSIHARLVSGYYGGHYEPDKQLFQFRRKDAHAWVEVLLPDRGWVQFDPSPPRALLGDGDGFGVIAALKHLLETLQLKWTAFVVAFDSEIRDDLVGQFGQWFLNLKEGRKGTRSFRQAAQSLIWGPELLTAGQRLLYWIVLLLWVALVLLLIRTLWIVLLMLRAYLPAPKTSSATFVRRPEARFYDQLVMLLASKGYNKAPDVTPREFAGWLARAQPDFADMPDFTEWFYAAQFGRVGLAPDRRRRLRDFLKRLREEPAFGTRRVDVRS